MPIQGNLPFIIYTITYPIDYKSSLLLYSIPKWELILTYLAVPVKLLFYLYGICCYVFVSLYFLANPKSII